MGALVRHDANEPASKLEMSGTRERTRLVQCGTNFVRHLKGQSHIMSDRQSIVRDPETIRARAMETLFERLETSVKAPSPSIAPGASSMSTKNTCIRSTSIGLGCHRASDRGDHPEQPDARSRETGKPILLDVLETGREPLVVTRMPLKDDRGDDGRRDRLRAIRRAEGAHAAVRALLARAAGTGSRRASRSRRRGARNTRSTSFVGTSAAMPGSEAPGRAAQVESRGAAARRNRHRQGTARARDPRAPRRAPRSRS